MERSRDWMDQAEGVSTGFLFAPCSGFQDALFIDTADRSSLQLLGLTAVPQMCAAAGATLTLPLSDR